MRTRWFLILAAMASSILPHDAYADESDAARGIAEAIIKSATVRCLSDRDFDIASGAFHGKVRAVDPEQRVVVEIKDLQLAEGQLLATYTIASRFGFAGRMTTDEATRDLKCTADVRVLVELTATYRAEGEAFVVDARIMDLDRFDMEVVELTPGDLPEGKEQVVRLAKKAADENVEVLIRAIDKWLAEHNRY